MNSEKYKSFKELNNAIISFEEILTENNFDKILKNFGLIIDYSMESLTNSMKNEFERSCKYYYFPDFIENIWNEEILPELKHEKRKITCRFLDEISKFFKEKIVCNYYYKIAEKRLYNGAPISKIKKLANYLRSTNCIANH